MSHFVVISSAESNYVRRVVRRLCEQNQVPRIVLLGSKAQRLYFKLQSFRRIRAQLGIKEAIHRLRQSRSAVRPAHNEPTISELQSKYGFAVQMFDAMNSGTILISLLGRPDTIAILAGAGLADRATIAAVDGRCINAHPALLPGIRGVDVLEWALVKGKPTGVSAHLVVPSVDAGGILKTRELHPDNGEPFDSFVSRIQELQADVLAEAAIEYAEGRAIPLPHDLTKSELCFVAPKAVKDQARDVFARLSDGRPAG